MSEAKIQIKAGGADSTISDVKALEKAVVGLAERAQKMARGDLINGIVDGIGKAADALGGMSPVLAETLKNVEEIGKSLARDGIVGAGFNSWGIVIAHVTRELQAERAELDAMRATRAATLAHIDAEIAGTKAKIAAIRELTAARIIEQKTGDSIDEQQARTARDRAAQATVAAELLQRQQDVQLDALKKEAAEAAKLDVGSVEFRKRREEADRAVDIAQGARNQAARAAEAARQTEQLANATVFDDFEKRAAEQEKKRQEEALARKKTGGDQAKKIAEDAATFANKVLLDAQQRELDADAAFAVRHREQRQREFKAAEAEAKETKDRQTALAREDDERQAIARQLQADKATKLKEEQAAQDADIVSAQIDEDIRKQEDFNAAVEGAATASLGVLKDIVTGQGDVTKAALESKAQQAAIEAAFQTATGLGLLAIGSPSAASAFTAAAQFAAIAATAGVASLAASSAPAAPAASQGGRSGGSGPSSSGGGGTNITVVLPQSGRLYPMNDELLRGVRAANREASRR